MGFTPKFKSRFNVIAKVSKPTEEQRGKFREALASEHLKKMLPQIDCAKNPDVLPISFDTAVVNLVNSNDDGVLTAEAKLVNPLFVYKPINIEHDRCNTVGCILSHGYSIFGSSDELKEDELPEDEPFNLCHGGVLWRVVDEFYTDMVEQAEKEQSISASWEIGFDDYVLALGSKKLKDAEIISDAAQIKELGKCLRCEGGQGYMKDGTPVYRILKGNMYGLGVGLTWTPAAAVQGVTVSSSETCAALERVKSAPEEEKKKIFIFLQENSANKENKEIKRVNKRSMIFKEIADINDDILKEAKASDVRDFIKSELIKQDTAFKAKLSEAETKAESAKDEAKAKEEKAKELENSVLTLKAELQALKDKEVAKAKEESFKTRLEQVKAKYTLDEQVCKIVEGQIKDLDDAAFASWQTQFAVLAKSLEKTPETTKTKEATASTIVEGAKVDKSDVPNGSTTEEDYFAKASKAFTIKITNKGLEF